MLTKEYEQAYVSSFYKIFKVLNEYFDLYVIKGECENYEIEVKKINNEEVNGYLSICFQKQNGSLTVISDNKLDDDLVNKLVKYVSLALNEEPVAAYNFTDLKDYTVYHFEYVKENKIIDNKKMLENMLNNKQIENANFNIGNKIKNLRSKS